MVDPPYRDDIILACLYYLLYIQRRRSGHQQIRPATVSLKTPHLRIQQTNLNPLLSSCYYMNFIEKIVTFCDRHDDVIAGIIIVVAGVIGAILALRIERYLFE